MPGARRTHCLACTTKKDARRPTQVRRNHSGTPCAMVLRLLRALPGVSGLLASVARGIITRELDPSVEGSQRPLSEVRCYRGIHFRELRKARGRWPNDIFECRFRFEVPGRTCGR